MECLLYSTEALEPGDYILVLGPKDKRLYIKGTCKRCLRSDLGTFQVGMEFICVLMPNDLSSNCESFCHFGITRTTTTTHPHPRPTSDRHTGQSIGGKHKALAQQTIPERIYSREAVKNAKTSRSS